MIPGPHRRSSRQRYLVSTLLLVLAIPGFPAYAVVQDSAEFEVRYRSAETVYLGAGTTSGLAVGDQLTIVRSGELIAHIEVVFAAEHSASCKVLTQSSSIQKGDKAIASELSGVVETAPATAAGNSVKEQSEVEAVETPVQQQQPQLEAAAIFARRGGITMEVVTDGPNCVPIHETPGPDSPRIDCLAAGTMGTMVGISASHWRALWLATGERGWVPRKSLRVVSAPAVQRAAAISSPSELVYRVKDDVSTCLTLRSEPILSSTPRDCLERGTRGTVSDSQGVWRKLLLPDGREGWVAARFIEPLVGAGGERIASASSSEGGRGGQNDDTAGRAGAAADRSAPEQAAIDNILGSRGRPGTSRSKKRNRTRVSGSLTVDWEDFADESEDPFDFQQFSARLSLRVRNIGGSPYSFRMRMRTRENEAAPSGGLSETRRQDRFYEMSLSYEPTEGPLEYRVGRISTSPVVSSGYMDGMLGSTSVLKNVHLGGFFGARSDVEQIGFESTGQLLGMFARLTNPPESTSNIKYDVVLAGARENGETDVSREFISLQSRLSSGSKWFVYQRAEFDLNRGWREELAESSSQLSNFSLTATRRLREISRLTLSYDRFEQYRTEETRSIPDELFNNLLRQGVRASLQVGRPRKLNFTLNAGLRTEENESHDTLSYGFSVRHPDVASRDLSLSANILGFSNPFNEGYVATVSATKRLMEGSQVSLSLGNRLSQSVLMSDLEDLSTQWARLGGWVELPKNLFANGEYEVTTGDEYQGKRLSLGLGYRF